MRKTRHILYSLLAASLMTACTQDEHTGGSLPEGRVPMVLNAGGLQVTATPDTRGIFDGDWSDVTQIAVTETSTDEGKKTYTVTPAADYSTAELIPEDEANTIWWNYNDEVKTITAWHPVDKKMPQVGGSWTVTADQRDGIPVDEDLLYASRQVTLQNPYLTFRHLLSKVVINIRQSDYLQNYSLTDVEVTMDNICLDGKFELGTYEELILNNDGGTGTIVHPHRCDQAASGCFATYEALVMPQSVTTMDSRNIIIQVDGVQYVWGISLQTMGNNSFDSGCQYTFNITVDAKGLDVQVSESIDWNATNPGSGNLTLKDHYDQATNTYYVYTAEGLYDWATIARTDLTVNCILMDDIDYNDNEWTAIGDPVNQYAGTFDGGGHTIRNITIKDNAQNNGLFGYIAGGGTVKNLTVKNASMTTSGTKYGIIAAWNDGTIENCVVSSCRITGSSDYVGCISYQNFGRISRCRVDDANVSCGSFGGIVWLNQGRIEASSFQGHINADGGALVDINGITGGTIIACWTDATHQEGKTVAGIVRNLYGGSVTACYYGGDMDTGILDDRTGIGDATKVGGSSFWTWEEAADLMNKELGSDFGWHWQTDNGYTPPTLVPNN